GVRIALLSYTSVCVPSFAATVKRPGAATIRINTRYEESARLIMQPGSPMAIRTSGEPADVAMLIADIEAAKVTSDIVIVCWHWGISERWGKLAEYQRTLGHAAIEAGAHAIIGHHAHMLAGAEFHRGRPIFYSLGNFGFEMDHEYFRRESVMVQFDVSKSG